MQPTAKLRILKTYQNRFGELIEVEFLQQWWDDGYGHGEWRDVEVVYE